MAVGFVVLSHGTAGSNEDRALGGAFAVLAEHAPTELARVADDADVDGALEGSRAGHVLVAAGGDGTLHHLVARLHARGALSDRTIGVLPLGTANDFARARGIPLDPEAAARVVAANVSRSCDLVVADDGTVAVNAAHVGIGADAARRASRLKPMLGPLSYAFATAWLGSRPRRLGIELDADGNALGGDDVLYAGVANSDRLGGGHRVHPHARRDDGSLAVLVVHDHGVPARARLALRLLRGDVLDDPSAEWVRARTLEVRGAGGRWDVDGEDVEVAVPVVWRVQQRAFRLLVPAPDRSGSGRAACPSLNRRC